jgi:membrane-associated phospholipid phosphatase
MKNTLLLPIRKFGLPETILIICAGLVYWLLGFGLYQDGWFAWDAPLMLALHGLSQPWLDTLFFGITHTVQAWMVLPICLMLVYLWRREEKITAILLIAAAAIFPLVSLIVKQFFARPRQTIFPPIDIEHTYSFPSGHTLTAVGVYGFIAILLWQRGHRWLAALSGIWVIFVAVSRVYLGAHYPSDVFASLAVGTIMLIILQFVARYLNR